MLWNPWDMHDRFGCPQREVNPGLEVKIGYYTSTAVVLTEALLFPPCVNTHMMHKSVRNTHSQCVRGVYKRVSDVFSLFLSTRCNSHVLWGLIRSSITVDGWHCLPCLENVSHASTPLKEKKKHYKMSNWTGANGENAIWKKCQIMKSLKKVLFMEVLTYSSLNLDSNYI